MLPWPKTLPLPCTQPLWAVSLSPVLRLLRPISLGYLFLFTSSTPTPCSQTPDSGHPDDPPHNSAHFFSGPISQPSTCHKPFYWDLQSSRGVVGASSIIHHLLSERSLLLHVSLLSPLQVGSFPPSSYPWARRWDGCPWLFIFPHLSLRTSRLECPVDRLSPAPPCCCHLLCQHTHTHSFMISALGSLSHPPVLLLPWFLVISVSTEMIFSNPDVSVLWHPLLGEVVLHPTSIIHSPTHILVLIITSNTTPEYIHFKFCALLTTSVF